MVSVIIIIIKSQCLYLKFIHQNIVGISDGQIASQSYLKQILDNFQVINSQDKFKKKQIQYIKDLLINKLKEFIYFISVKRNSNFVMEFIESRQLIPQTQ
ncbi:hypothetical protein TTHERM_002653449 (macronuclear) [Tetrahymena thermophila SB210]|uniref:Uncharacterized protein n=1 Tax=Tetrahymena thermophila (strain SB210) TaxID=312017 RepID=W7WWR8_TETTS|nr:hypothetical protein TTHERM_002653449 [Tetrahymena thermophila SB210]EWS71260.1 hypothetical protein TTHERM_002653449 [Tetrahymena thermophila SB210]|eukprot:XP_012656204.1 hypothetical protein TTHERM_002653449 [Tetrahymena thermophila SB210]